MKEKFIKELPDWYKSDKKFDLVLSDDLDGLVSTSALRHAKGWEVQYFYDFEELYCTGKVYFNDKKSDTRVWSDVALLKNEMCFDNHVSRKSLDDYRNTKCINPNLMTDVSNENYFDKYCGSTALLIWSVYNIPLPTTEEGKMLLLAIDSTFKGFYSKYSQFQKRNKYYLCDVLGFEELYEVEKRHTANEFYELIAKYKMSSKTTINGEKLNTDLDLKVIGELLGIDIELPEVNFLEWKEFEAKQANLNDVPSVKNIKRVVTLAFTGKNFAKYSTLKAS